MKRPQESTDDMPTPKKHKSSDAEIADVDGWTKVEKRRLKKQKKAEIKSDVCVFSPPRCYQRRTPELMSLSLRLLLR